VPGRIPIAERILRHTDIRVTMDVDGTIPAIYLGRGERIRTSDILLPNAPPGRRRA